MKTTFEECRNCDGCGWYEGGKTLQTTCEKCKGRGVLAIERGVKRPITDAEHNRLRRQIDKAERRDALMRKRGFGPKRKVSA